MKKIILAPDSFKGTMNSITICCIMEDVIKRHFSSAEIIKVPVADGGEGTIDCFLEAVGGEKINVRIKGPYFEEIDACYGILPDGNTAIIEMAQAAGLPLVEGRMNPSITTTYGVGQLIIHAVARNCTNIIIGLGGSCTNDGGCGMAAAMGIRFYDHGGKLFVPTGKTLKEIAFIDTSARSKMLDECSITAMCDVNNSFCGPNGAAFVFAPQKGADEKMVHELDDNLQYLESIIKSQLKINIAELPSAGAAGGMGGGVVAFLNARLMSGIETVLATTHFDSILDGADLVFTGEGKIDTQSLSGKVVIGVAERAAKKQVPVIAVVGDIGDDIDGIYPKGVTAVVSINRVAVPFEAARKRCKKDLSLTVDTIMRLLNIRQ